jgi:hypothetical protein
MVKKGGKRDKVTALSLVVASRRRNSRPPEKSRRLVRTVQIFDRSPATSFFSPGAKNIYSVIFGRSHTVPLVINIDRHETASQENGNWAKTRSLRKKKEIKKQ